MKKLLKKVTAIAFALTLIGAETALTKRIAPQATDSLTAYAATCNNCHGGSYHVTTYEKAENDEMIVWIGIIPVSIPVTCNYRIEECTLCHSVISKTLLSVRYR